MSARGNSGVILSQIVRGAAEVLAEPARSTPTRVARALRGASDAAYRAVRRPVEGTMLTVVRELAEEAERRRHSRGPLAPFLVELVRHGEEALARTPEQLDVLREAGVVDAGGAGLVEIVRGIAAAVAGEPLAEAGRSRRSGRRRPPPGAVAYRYCTVFVVEGERPRRGRARARARAARRLPARRRRRERAEGPRAHGRPGRGAQRSSWRSASRAGRDREHAPADDRSARSGSRGDRRPAEPRRRARRSPSSPARGTAACSRASARARSSRAARR